MKESKLYELIDDDNTSRGVINTNAPMGVVSTVWKRVYNVELNDTDKEAIRKYDAWDMSYCDWVIAILKHRRYEAYKLETIEIYS